ncbi:ABC transporter substrate-binding protein [Curtobacterium sp. VKM Ac-1395]|jgi:raffinose/stachyose/melibiose transport system substrate-binding protein|uniref:ABC transporter substrate-binding protein n=1 Tax=Curtobacterium sp. VKM Ac-1395 TaxID=2783815 RepID=UPI00188C9A4A|nr:extracellular solute-binding protein [Curtobacterium sp. VKM Ac-1395]MBF4590578.1 extracellular solute-binding protein [Curtobacterium sp. VKM Ac-1395]
MRTTRTARRLLAGIVATALVGVGLVGCASSGGDSSDGKTFTIWQYEAKDSAQYQSWRDAVTTFKEKHPDVDVKLVSTSFDNMQKNAKLLLTGNKVPDVVEVNKGNADAGQLASQGLIENLDPQVQKYGWDEKVKGAMSSLARYDRNGNAGSGSWYGVPNIGEVIVWFYNKDAFAKAGITEAPTTMDELERDMQTFKDQGTTPVASGANAFGALWTWYSLVSAKADRKLIDNYMFLKGSPSLDSGAFAEGTEQFQQWIDKGYLGSKLAGVTGDQMDATWLSGKSPLIVEDSAAFNRFKADAKFDWGTFTLPGASLNAGSSGHLWAVPTKSGNKELAYDWINTTLSSQVQNAIGKRAGLPLAGDPSVISDPQTKALTQQFADVVDKDQISFFPDYPVPGLLDFQQSGMQAMVNKTKTADEFTKELQAFYSKGKKQVDG